MDGAPAALGISAVAAVVVSVVAGGPIGLPSGPKEATRPVFDFRTALADCEPVDGSDPYPLDEVFADHNVTTKGEWLFVGACLVNGEDRTVREDADGCYEYEEQGFVTVRRGDEWDDGGEVVLRRPQDSGWTRFAWVCEHVPDLPPNEEWIDDERRMDGRREVAWDLHKDICADDYDPCHDEHPDEGERVPGGTYVVRVTYPDHVHEPDWRRTVELPPAS